MIYNNFKKAFTLLEILLAVAALVILATIVIIAINPFKTLKETENAKRLMNKRNIEKALVQYVIDNDGQFPSSLIDNNLYMIGESSSDCDYFFSDSLGTSLAECLNLKDYLVPNYLVDIPYDPKLGSDDITYYAILKNDNQFKVYSYLLNSNEESLGFLNLVYQASEGGFITGEINQTVLAGEAGTEVLATAYEDYEFVSWSDGVFDNPRLDTNILSNLEVEAVFQKQVVWTTCGDPITFDYNGSSVTYNTVLSSGNCWLDRNLGAARVPNSRIDSQGYGDYFQWGREADGHQLLSSDTTDILSVSDKVNHSDFIIANSSPFDWRSPQNNSLWQGESGTNNPCPPGWRLPIEAEMQAERLSWSSNNRDGAFNSPLRWPSSGYKGGGGSLLVSSNIGYAWTSSVHTTNARTLAFIIDNAYVLSFNRALAFPVRCIKE